MIPELIITKRYRQRAYQRSKKLPFLHDLYHGELVEKINELTPTLKDMILFADKRFKQVDFKRKLAVHKDIIDFEQDPLFISKLASPKLSQPLIFLTIMENIYGQNFAELLSNLLLRNLLLRNLLLNKQNLVSGSCVIVVCAGSLTFNNFKKAVIHSEISVNNAMSQRFIELPNCHDMVSLFSSLALRDVIVDRSLYKVQYSSLQRIVSDIRDAGFGNFKSFAQRINHKTYQNLNKSINDFKDLVEIIYAIGWV